MRINRVGAPAATSNSLLPYCHARLSAISAQDSCEQITIRPAFKTFIFPLQALAASSPSTTVAPSTAVARYRKTNRIVARLNNLDIPSFFFFLSLPFLLGNDDQRSRNCLVPVRPTIQSLVYPSLFLLTFPYNFPEHWRCIRCQPALRYPRVVGVFKASSFEDGSSTIHREYSVCAPFSSFVCFDSFVSVRLFVEPLSTNVPSPFPSRLIYLLGCPRS